MPDCYTQEEIADKVGVDQTTIAKWVMIFRNIADFHNPPESRQHFDVAPGTHCFWRSLYTLFHRKKMQGGTGANQYKEQRGQNDLSAQSENAEIRISCWKHCFLGAFKYSYRYVKVLVTWQTARYLHGVIYSITVLEAPVLFSNKYIKNRS